jgi:hypothetical protein
MSTETVRPAVKKEEELKPIVIDFGKHSRKNVKKICKGKSGKLMDKVHDAVAQLREEGVMAVSAQPVIIVVRQRRRSRRGFSALLR